MSELERPTSEAEASVQPKLFQRLTNWLRPDSEAESVRDVIEGLIEERNEERTNDGGLIDSHERLLLANVLRLRDIGASDIMVPRADIVAIEADTPPHDVLRFMVKEGHSRVPVYRQSLDDVIGLIHIKDLAVLITDQAPNSTESPATLKLNDIIRQMLFVSPAVRILDLLLEMRLKRTHMAMVVDEYGGIDGLITIEDVVEQIVGEIEDEHDIDTAPRISLREDGTLIADARVTLEEFESRYGRVFSDDERDATDTLGGLVIRLAGRMPTRNELVKHPSGIEFEVTDGDPRRVRRLRIRNLPPSVQKLTRHWNSAMFAEIAARAGALTGWRRLAVGFAAGAITTAALPPYFIVPALWIALPPFLWLLNGCRSRRSVLCAGWAFGFGHFLFGLSWIIHPFYVDAATFGVFAWPAFLGLTFAMGVFFAAVAIITHLIPPTPTDAAPLVQCRRMTARALLFAAAWMLQEWVRSWILTGFPWNPIATVWAESQTPIGLAMLQSVSVVGTFGLSLITVAAAALVSSLGTRTREAVIWALAPIVVLIVMDAGGALRLAQGPTTFAANVNLRLVQPNIPQAEKWRPELREPLLLDYVRLSTENRPADINVVIWGEDSVSFLLDRDLAHRAIAATAVPSNGVLIAGADRAESETRIFNSLYVIAPDGSVLATYDKFHLVPFGEFMPLARYLPFRQLTGDIGFSSGPGLRTLSIPGLPPFTPLICFEAIFPGDVVAEHPRSARWLVNLTNDSWFGSATGPYQHFATARLRAIEEGLPLVRTANTGISAVVDSYGRVIQNLGLNRRGVIDAPLPESLPSLTVFAMLGNWVSLAVATIISCVALVEYRRTR